MDWRVNYGLYHRFLKWKLKCENILDCELGTLPESKKYKKVIAWSVILEWISMFTGACSQNNSAWMSYGPDMMFFAGQK